MSVAEVGFVGESGVGKTTLLNALLSERLAILPQGAVGPVTALPVRVCFSADPEFDADYIEARELELLHEELVALEGQRLTRRGRRTLDGATVRRARLLVQGSQFARGANAYLADALQAMLGKCSVEAFDPADRARIERVRDCLGAGRTPISAGQALPDFLAAVAEHVGGFLAPLCRELRIGWNSPLLKGGLALVDLPGLGVANDSYRAAAAHWFAAASTIVVVVGRSGIPASVGRLLLESGFLRRAGGRQPAATVTIAVTGLDSAARDARRGRGLNGPRATTLELLDQHKAAAIQVIRGQLRALVGSFGSATEREQLLDRITVHPVCAIEYQRWFRRDPEESSMLAEPEASGIPVLQRRLSGLVSCGVD